MRKILTAAMALLCNTAFAQKIDAGKLPRMVPVAFNKTFPGARNVQWEKEKGNYEANFTQDGKKMAATYDDKGEWLETESPVTLTSLPEEIRAYLDKNYKGQAIKETTIIKTKTVTKYEVALKGKDLIFDDKGKFLKSEKD